MAGGNLASAVNSVSTPSNAVVTITPDPPPNRIDLSDLGGKPAVAQQPASVDLSDLGGKLMAGAPVFITPDATPQFAVPPGTPTMGPGPQQSTISKAVDTVANTEVPGTGVTIGEATHRAVDFGKIAGAPLSPQPQRQPQKRTEQQVTELGTCGDYFAS